MYLPSKLRFKHIGFLAIFIFLLILPFKGVLQNIFFFSTRMLMHSPRKTDQKIAQVEEKNLEFMLKLRAMENLQEENQTLRDALNFTSQRNLDLVGAEVISFDPSSWRRIVIINAGTTKGVKDGMIAISEEGWLIGKVIDAKPHYSRIILVDDPGFTLPVFVGENAFGLLKGTLSGVAITYIENEEDVAKGDKIWLKIGFNAAPIYVGEVKKVKKTKDSLFWDINAKLYSKATFLHKIYIIQ